MPDAAPRYVVVTKTINVGIHGEYVPMGPGIYRDARKTHPLERDAEVLYVYDGEDLRCINTMSTDVVVLSEDVVRTVRESPL